MLIFIVTIIQMGKNLFIPYFMMKYIIVPNVSNVNSLYIPM